MIKGFKEWMGLLSYLSMLKMSAKSFFFLKSCLKKKADAVVGQNDNLGFHLSIFYLCASLLKAHRKQHLKNLAKILFWELQTASFCAPCNLIFSSYTQKLLAIHYIPSQTLGNCVFFLIGVFEKALLYI